VERRISIYHRKHGLFLFPTSQTADLGWIGTAPGLAVTDGAGDHLLGTCARALLLESRQDVPPSPDWKEAQHPVHEFAGVQGWRDFEDSARLVTVAETAEGFRVGIWLNDKDAFSAAAVPDIRLAPSASPEELGNAIRAGLEAAAAKAAPDLAGIQERNAERVGAIVKAPRALVFIGSAWSAPSKAGEQAFRQAVAILKEHPDLDIAFFRLERTDEDEACYQWLSSLGYGQFATMGAGSFLWFQAGQVLAAEVNAMTLGVSGIVARSRSLWAGRAEYKELLEGDLDAYSRFVVRPILARFPGWESFAKLSPRADGAGNVVEFNVPCPSPAAESGLGLSTAGEELSVGFHTHYSRFTDHENRFTLGEVEAGLQHAADICEERVGVVSWYRGAVFAGSRWVNLPHPDPLPGLLDSLGAGPKLAPRRADVAPGELLDGLEVGAEFAASFADWDRITLRSWLGRFDREEEREPILDKLIVALLSADTEVRRKAAKAFGADPGPSLISGFKRALADSGHSGQRGAPGSMLTYLLKALLSRVADDRSELAAATLVAAYRLAGGDQRTVIRESLERMKDSYRLDYDSQISESVFFEGLIGEYPAQQERALQALDALIQRLDDTNAS
jgi:hypothetical protein